MESVKLTVQLSCRKDLFLVCRCPNVGKRSTERQMQQQQPRLQSAKWRPALHRCAAPSALGRVSYGSFGGSPRTCSSGRTPPLRGRWCHVSGSQRGLEPWADWCCDLVLAPPLLSRGVLSTGGLRGRGARTTIPAPRGTLHSPTEDRGPDGGAAGPSEAPSADPTLGVLPPCVPL